MAPSHNLTPKISVKTDVGDTIALKANFSDITINYIDIKISMYSRKRSL